MTRTVEEILGKDSIAKLQEPIETARGLPRAAYTTEEFFELEQERLFPRTWQGIGFVDDVPEPGVAIPITVSGLPLILVHDTKGKIRCFHNVCRHRATIVLQKPEKGLSNLQCPYHAWTWDLEGNLKATPYFDGTPNSENFQVDASQKRSGPDPLRRLEQDRLRQPRRQRGPIERVSGAGRKDGRRFRSFRPADCSSRVLGIRCELEARERELGGLPSRLGA